MSRFASTVDFKAAVRGTSASAATLALLGLLVNAGCDRQEPIVTYSVPTKVPQQLQAENDRMLAVILPKGADVWFLKVRGPEQAVGGIEPIFRKFAQQIQFTKEGPDLASLPEGWRLGANKPSRYATLNVDTPGKQLNISITNLRRQDDLDEFIKMNVNRWRGQIGLEPSDEKWAAAERLDIAVADASSVYVDLVGPPESGTTMAPPFARSGMTPDPSKTLSNPGDDQAAPTPPDPRLKYERPDGWRDGNMSSSMRMAAFSIGPEESPAELTVIPAGGDTRDNVARWLGQIRGGEVSDKVVDQALANATAVEVDGREGKRFLLTGEDATTGTVIDATIVPLGNAVSLFVKMTGPAKTVNDQSEAIASFLDSLELNL